METYTIQCRQKAEDFIQNFRQFTRKEFSDDDFYKVNKELFKGGIEKWKNHVLVPGNIVFIPTGVTHQFMANVVQIQVNCGKKVLR